MANPHGSPIWYELVTADPEAAKRFYDAVVPGWDMEPTAIAGPIDYRSIRTPGGHAGGVLLMTPEMKAGGARACWLLYVGVDDVDATLAKASGLGAHVLMPASDVEGVGRFALLADPQGAPFYVMRPVGDQTSTVFARGNVGHCGWNELTTTDFAAALGFYTALFGWENRETMDMGAMGGYHFLDLGDLRLGAAVEMKERPAHWTLYFTVPDVDAAAKAVGAAGGTVDMGPLEVPGGEHILIGRDPEGVVFALVAPPKAP